MTGARWNLVGTPGRVPRGTHDELTVALTEHPDRPRRLVLREQLREGVPVPAGRRSRAVSIPARCIPELIAALEALRAASEALDRGAGA